MLLHKSPTVPLIFSESKSLRSRYVACIVLNSHKHVMSCNEKRKKKKSKPPSILSRSASSRPNHSWRPNGAGPFLDAKQVDGPINASTRVNGLDVQRRYTHVMPAYFPAHPSCPLQDYPLLMGPIDYPRYSRSRLVQSCLAATFRVERGHRTRQVLTRRGAEIQWSTRR